MAHNFQRPNLPYEGTSLDNDNRYQLLTGQSRGVHFAALDGEANFYIDALRQLDADIANLVAGNLQGSDILANAGFMVTTDGAGNIGWIKVQDSNIVPASITNISLFPGTITANEIANGTITTLKIAPLNITTGLIADGAITRNQIALKTITGDKIVNSTITSNLIEAFAITTTLIANGSILTNKVANGAITTPLIANGAITTPLIANGAITTPLIANGAITSVQIAPLTITAAQIANNTITLTQISNAFTATKAQQQAAASSSVYTSPATQQYHPSAASFWVKFVGSTGVISASNNVASITRNSTGNYTINFTNSFSSSDYAPFITVTGGTSNPISTVVLTQSSASVSILIFAANSLSFDPSNVYVVGFGTLA